jgi:hypothetical protein
VGGGRAPQAVVLGFGGRAEGDQLVTRAEPVARQSHDVALGLYLYATRFGMPTVGFHRFADLFS